MEEKDMVQEMNPDTAPADEAEEMTQEAPAEEEAGTQEPGTQDTPEPDTAKDEEKAPEDGAQSEKKGFFKKKEKKDKKDEQIADLTDKLKRQLAEFENFRNRTEREKAQMYSVGAREVIEKILPVVDNFERGLKSIPEEEQGGPVASGMEMIYKQLMAVLTDLGVTPIDAVGQEFDPEFHNAVMHVEDGELGENVIAEEFQKGYKYKDAVLRHSMVKVAN